MAATFRSLNNDVGPLNPAIDATAMKVSTQLPMSSSQTHDRATMDDATTPTRATFSHGNGNVSSVGQGALAAQKPLPTSPFPDAVQVPEPSEKPLPMRDSSRRLGESEDVEMNDSDGEDAGPDDAGSDDESVNADGSRTKTKKKSQRFYCTEYPPCNLSFTRSEHLARHIRKHTGERPFQCHCSRRFSRLDNLRQHAQTVHVNEDIPMDSLAATNARFARQQRQERTRPTQRVRAATTSGSGAPVRGHSKSLSTSSITNIGGIGASYSNATRDDITRHRPPPLAMGHDARSRLSGESYHSGIDSQYSYRPHSPSDFSTPTSATFSTGQSSPRYIGSGVASPGSTQSRAHSMYVTGSHTPGRRLSVPSVSGNPFQSPHGSGVGRPLFGHGGLPSSSVFSPTNGSIISSPTMSPAGGWSRRESMSSVTDESWRRRTWHPDSREFGAPGSRLSNVVTHSDTVVTNSVAPLALPSSGHNPQSAVRLPGIESFDSVPRANASPPQRIPSPMMMDSNVHAAPPTILLPSTEPQADTRPLAHWDMGLHRGITKLDLSSNPSPRDSAGLWAREANNAVQAQAEQVRDQLHARTHPTVRFETEARVVPLPQPMAQPVRAPPVSNTGFFRGHSHTMSAPSITSRQSKRHGWYNGPAPLHGDISEGNEPKEPRSAHVDRMTHPNLANGFSGFPVREQHPPDRSVETDGGRGQTQQPDSMRRLEALVAVATGEGPTAAAY